MTIVAEVAQIQTFGRNPACYLLTMYYIFSLLNLKTFLFYRQLHENTLGYTELGSALARFICFQLG